MKRIKKIILLIFVSILSITNYYGVHAAPYTYNVSGENTEIVDDEKDNNDRPVKCWVGWKEIHFGATTPISKKDDPVHFKRPMIQNGKFTGYYETDAIAQGYGYYGLNFSKQVIGLLSYMKNKVSDYTTEYIPIYDQPEFNEDGTLKEPSMVNMQEAIQITIGKLLRNWYSRDYEVNEFRNFWEKSFTTTHLTELTELQNKFYWQAYGESAFTKLKNMMNNHGNNYYNKLTPVQKEVLKGVVLSIMEARYRNKNVQGKANLKIKAAEGELCPFLVYLENLNAIKRTGEGPYTYIDDNAHTTFYQFPNFDELIIGAYLWMHYYDSDVINSTTHSTLTSKLSDGSEGEDIEVDWESEYYTLLDNKALPTLTGKELEEFYNKCHKVRNIFKKSSENDEGIFGAEELYDVTSEINFSEAITNMKSKMVAFATEVGGDIGSIWSGLTNDNLGRTYIMAKNIVEANRVKDEYAYYDIGLNIISYTPGKSSDEFILCDFQKIKLKSPLKVNNIETYVDSDDDGIYDRLELGDVTSISDKENTMKRKVDVTGFIKKMVERELYGNDEKEINKNQEYIKEVVAKVKYNIYQNRKCFDDENSENNKFNWKEVYENNLNVDETTKANLGVIAGDTAKIQYLKLSPAKLEVELWKYRSNPVLKDTDFDGIDDGAGKLKLKEIERQYDLTEENEDDLTVRYLRCKNIPHSTLEALRKDKRPKDNHFTGRMNSSRISGNDAIEVDMNMDYRYFFLSNKLYYDELSTMSLLYANSIYREGPTKHSGIAIKDIQNLYAGGATNVSTDSEVEHMSIDGIEYRNLKVKDMMEFYGFKDVRTYYMGSPCDEGDENKEYFNQYMQNVNNINELHIPENEIDTDYKARIWSNGVIRIGTKYKDVDEIYLGYKDTHKGRVAIGHKTIQYHNRYKTVIGIVIRGTAEDDDWDSDFDMGDVELRNKFENVKAGINNYDRNYENIQGQLNAGLLDKYDKQYSQELLHFAGGYPDWTHISHHAGFDIVSNRIIEVLNNYYAEFNNSFNDEIEIFDNNTIETAVTANSRRSDDNSFVDDGICFWVTGHSMGGGVANLVSAELIDKGYEDNVYSYTFAAPNTFYRTDNDKDNYREPHGSKYRCIFNIVNDDDFVPKLPMEECEWTKYGRVAKVSIECDIRNNVSKDEKYYKYLKEDYKSYKLAVDIVIGMFNGMYDNQTNMRSESYSYDNKIGKTTIKYELDEKLDDDILYYAEYTKPYQKYVFNNGYIQNQMPAYLMLSIANSMHENIKDKDLNGAYRKQRKDKKYLYVIDVSENQYTMLTTKYGYNSWGAKWSLVIAGSPVVNAIEAPHYLETYYTLTKELSTIDFR